MARPGDGVDLLAEDRCPLCGTALELVDDIPALCAADGISWTRTNMFTASGEAILTASRPLTVDEVQAMSRRAPGREALGDNGTTPAEQIASQEAKKGEKG